MLAVFCPRHERDFRRYESSGTAAARTTRAFTTTRRAGLNRRLRLKLIRRGEWEVRDVQNVADVLVDPEGSLDKRNHWEKTSHSLLVGAILHVLYAEADKTLAG